MAGRVLTWIRVSVNFFDGWEDKVRIDNAELDPSCVIGCSVVLSAEHESSPDRYPTWGDRLRAVSSLADCLDALSPETMLAQHSSVERLVEEVGDPRFFHHHKISSPPRPSACHQGYFRPYLSEEPWTGDGLPGSVYPCDSVVLNDGSQVFDPKYQRVYGRGSRRTSCARQTTGP